MKRGIHLHYAVGDAVLIRATVDQIHVDKDGKVTYALMVKEHEPSWSTVRDRPVITPEDEIVCRWIERKDE